MKLSKLLQFLDKRKENNITIAGFIAGAVLGIIIGLYIFLSVLILKEATLNQLETEFKPYAGINISPLSIYYITLIVTPIIVVIIHMIIGTVLGIVVNKLKKPSAWKIISGSIVLGAVFGFITSAPAPRVITFSVCLAAWFVFSIVFLVTSHFFKKEPIDTSPKS